MTTELYEEVEQTEADAPEEDDDHGLFEAEIVSLATATRDEFHITDEGSADFIANLIRRTERERADYKAEAARRDKQFERKIAWLKMRFGVEMEEYAVSQLAGQTSKNPKKSFRLPCGVQIGYRHKQPTIKVVDEAAYEASLAQVLPEALDFVVKVDKNIVNAAVLKDGILLEGVHVTEAYDEFYIKV